MIPSPTVTSLCGYLSEDDHHARGCIAAAALPFLKAFMQDAAAHAKPVALNGFPLTARPQHLPNSVHNRSVICWWSAAARMPFGLGQQATEAASQRAWNVKVIDIF
jgi:hypothetical protein